MRGTAGEILLLLILPLGGCLPYTVGSTAAPAPVNELEHSVSWFYLPAGFDLDSTRSLPFYGLDAEARFGIDERADFGVRVVSLSGFSLTYKRLVTDPARLSAGPNVAFMVGAGVVNVGNHGHLEGSLLASGGESGSIVPYAGLRAMQVVPMIEGAVSDSPTLGGFFGVRIGSRDLGVSPEIAVFYDRSALGIRNHDVIAVFAMTLHGERLIRALLR